MPEEVAPRGRALPSPGLAWAPGRVPVAERFGDVYYSREGGLAESRYVFLDGCSLPGAWQDGHDYTICELGFGTGLNFLATWDAWRRRRVKNARLHYIAVEGFPLLQSELSEALETWPELHTLVRGLKRAYPQPQRGFMRVFPHIPGDDAVNGISLTLLFGDALEMLTQLEARVDAWFLDGFAPDRNPDMWRAEVFKQIARLSHTDHGGSCLATFSAASEVRRGLDAAGFDVSKVAGFGKKREMIRARFRGGVQTETLLQPWFAHPPSSHGKRGHAAVIGAGIAGASAAYALNKRGWRTTIIERRGKIAAETSGNPVGILLPRLTASPDALDGKFYAAAWPFVLNDLETLAEANTAFFRDRCGVLQLATDEKESARQESILESAVLPEPFLFGVSAKEASDIASIKLERGALYFPNGGWVRPRMLCEMLAQNSNVFLNTDAVSLTHTHGLWQITNGSGNVITQADAVILANGLGTSSIPFTSWLPLAARRGQISMVPPTAMSANLRTVLSFGAYITPQSRGAHSIGATFDVTDAARSDDVAANSTDDARNIEAINAVLPDLLDADSLAGVHGRAGVRCTSPDHLPMCGPVPDQGAYLSDFAEVRHGHPWAKYPPAAYQAGLYVLTALGSRGFTAAALSAEILAAHITGEPWPLERDVMTALHPGRFLVRDLKRREA